MSGAKPKEEQIAQILALAKDCDATQLQLTTAQGYLLSRIDGQTPWRLLREIGGIPPGDVDVCLEQWLLDGLVEVVGQRSKAIATETATNPEPPTPEAQAEPEAAPVETDAASREFSFDESVLDESLELDLEVQRRILQFEASLTLPYHELLGVERGANPKVVKRAYFKLSKEFHPDRYFRREIGGYTARLERIFKKVLEAHEMLSDPELCQVENQAAAEAQGADPKPPTDAAEVPPSTPPKSPTSASSKTAPGSAKAKPAAAAKPTAPPRELSKLERLRQRMPFKIDPKAILERRAKADEIFRSAVLSQRAGRLQEAESNIRIAISFDPNRAEFKEALGSLKIEAAGDRAAKLLATPSDRMSDGELRDALRLLEDVLIYRPHDPQLNERAAQVCVRLNKFDDALEYAETLIEGSPEDAVNHALLGKILKNKGDTEKAKKAFESALKYDSENVEAKRTLAALRIGHHDAVQGGRT